ncbi:hypothetical protein B566_EDAN017717 [Ephemera danica]|nr:hypothetical protein B566_EDAN017717 [Ephemera danica]
MKVNGRQSVCAALVQLAVHKRPQNVSRAPGDAPGATLPRPGCPRQRGGGRAHTLGPERWMKPEETLVEVRSDSDVQIDRLTWV